MESNKKYVIGLDFGTDSCRALVVDTYTGREMATGVSFYPRWKAGLYCDAHNNRYRQHPLDYIESMTEAVHIALSDLKEEEIASICGLCFDTTGMPHCFMSSSTTATKDLFRNSVTSY
jgi:L-ribulokinase